MPSRPNFAVTFDCPIDNGPRYSFYVNADTIIESSTSSDLVVRILELLEEDDFYNSEIKISNGLGKRGGVDPLPEEEFKPFSLLANLHNTGVLYRKKF